MMPIPSHLNFEWVIAMTTHKVLNNYSMLCGHLKFDYSFSEYQKF